MSGSHPEKGSRKIGFWSLILLIVLLVFAILGAWALNALHRRAYESTGFAMGSLVQQTLYGPEGEKAAAEATQRIGMLDSLLSWRTEGSDIFRLNAAAGTAPITLDPRTYRVLSDVLSVAALSDGAYDPTILPLSSLWNFDGEERTGIPKPAQIEDACRHVDYAFLQLPGAQQAQLTDPYSAVDLGGAGKGAACEEALETYRSFQLTGGVVAVGGSIGVFGEKPDHSPWLISIRDPANAGGTLGTLSMQNGCVSTSGSYERFFVENNTVYHHLLDPETGYPSENGLVSVSVIHESGTLSDALATACFVLGREKGEALLGRFGAAGVFLDAQNQITTYGEVSFTLTSGNYTLLSS